MVKMMNNLAGKTLKADGEIQSRRHRMRNQTITHRLTTSTIIASIIFISRKSPSTALKANGYLPNKRDPNCLVQPKVSTNIGQVALMKTRHERNRTSTSLASTRYYHDSNSAGLSISSTNANGTTSFLGTPHSPTSLYGVRDSDNEGSVTEIDTTAQSGALIESSGGISTRLIAGATFGFVLLFSLGYFFIHQGENEITLNNLGQDLGVGLGVTILAGIYVKIWTTLVDMETLDPRDARKIIHTGSAPLFMLFWPFFSGAPWNRFFATAVPFINMVRLYQAGKGTEESSLARAVSRSGDIKEALGGPFAYVIILVAITSIFWRDTMTGVMAVTALAAGDGMADLVGRRLGKYTGNWPFAKSKSYAGTLAFIMSSSLAGIILCSWFGHFGAFSLELSREDQALRIVLISTVAAVVELIDVLDDNWTVPISAAILSYFLMR